MATDLERFVERTAATSRSREVRRRIDAEGIQYVYYQFPSVTGRIMGKGVPAKHWETIAEKGFQLVYGATANLFTDRHGNYIGYGPEAAELVGIPEPETFSRSLGLEGRARLVPAASATARSARTRRVPHLRLPREPEAHAGGVRGRDRAPPSRRHRARDDVAEAERRRHARVQGMTKPYCYHIDQFSELQPIIHKVIEYGQAMGLDMIQGDHEDAPGQIELNFGFDRAEKTADNLSTFRQICKAGRPRAQRLPVLHAEAVHGRLRERLPPQHLAVARRRERVHAGDGRPAEAEPDRPLRDRRDPRAPRRADRGHGVDGQLVPPAVGHRLLGAGLRRLGLPEPDDRAPRLRARAASSTAPSTRP